MMKKQKTRKVKVKFESVFQIKPRKAALKIFQALDNACRNTYSTSDRLVLARLRDMAAAAVGKNTLAQEDEE